MNRDQSVHVGMINSFNIITGKASIKEIIESGISVFAHLPNEDVDKELIEFMILYFTNHEMFEHCAELKKYISENFYSDGTPILNDCDCDYPSIIKYTYPMYCGSCSKKLK